MDDGNDAFWLSILASLDDSDSSDVILREVFGETTDSDAPPVLPAAKRKRRTNRSDELHRLRDTVAELEAQHDTLARRRSGKQPRTQRSVDVKSEGQVSVWKGVARRQYTLLRGSQCENIELRRRVEAQLDAVKRLARTVLRAQRGLPPQALFPAMTAAGVTTTSSLMSQELFVMARAMHEALDQVLASTRGYSEFEDLQVHKRQPAEILGGATLVSTIACRLVPAEVVSLADELWNNQDRLLAIQYFSTAPRRDHDEPSVALPFQFPAPEGDAVYHGVTLNVRISDAGREVILSLGSMWPDQQTPSPWNATQLLLRDWMVIEPTDCEGNQFHCVRTKTISFWMPQAGSEMVMTSRRPKR